MEGACEMEMSSLPNVSVHVGFSVLSPPSGKAKVAELECGGLRVSQQRVIQLQVPGSNRLLRGKP